MADADDRDARTGKVEASFFSPELSRTRASRSKGGRISEGIIVKDLGWAGLEPATNALKGRCSTIELPTRAGRTFLIHFTGRCKVCSGAL